MKRFELSSQERIDSCESTAREFFRAVLEEDFDDCVVTDESRLCDFASCGLPEDIADATHGLEELYSAWDAWVVPVICHRYEIEEFLPSILLVELFERIERRRPDQIH